MESRSSSRTARAGVPDRSPANVGTTAASVVASSSAAAAAAAAAATAAGTATGGGAGGQRAWSSPKRRKAGRAGGGGDEESDDEPSDDGGHRLADGGRDGAGTGAVDASGSAQKYRYYRQRAKQRQMVMEDEVNHLREENQILRDRENKLLYLVLMSRNRDRQLEVVERQRDELLMRLQYDTECAIAIRTLSAQLQAAVAARAGTVAGGIAGAAELAPGRTDEFLTDQSTQPATQLAGDSRSSQPDPMARDPPSPQSGSFARPPWQGNFFGSFGPTLAQLGSNPPASIVKQQPLQSPFGSLLGGNPAATAATAAAVDQTISSDMFPQLRDSLLKSMVTTEQESVRMAAASQAAYTAGVGAIAALNAFHEQEQRPEDALMKLARSSGQGDSKRSASPTDTASGTAPADGGSGSGTEPPLHAPHGFASRFRATSPAATSPTASPSRSAASAVGSTRRA